MKSSWQKLIRLWLVFALLSGCATTGVNNTADSTKTDAFRTKTEGTIIGTLLGAGLGAAIGAAVNGKQGAKKGAIIGGGTGLVAGYGTGTVIANRKQAYVDAEERLNQKIESATAANARLRAYNAQTAKRIAVLNRDIYRLQSQYNARRASFSQLQQKQSEIRASIIDAKQQKSNMAKELRSLNEYLANVTQTQQQTKAVQLQREVDLLKANIAMLDNNNKQMAKMADSLTVRR